MRTYKVNTDGINVGFSVCIACKLKQQTRLSNAGVSDEEEFEKVVTVVKEENRRHCENGDIKKSVLGFEMQTRKLCCCVKLDSLSRQPLAIVTLAG